MDGMVEAIHGWLYHGEQDNAQADAKLRSQAGPRGRQYLCNIDNGNQSGALLSAKNSKEMKSVIGPAIPRPDAYTPSPSEVIGIYNRRGEVR